MKLYRNISFIILFLFSLFSLGQETIINCYAPSFKGQIATLMTYEDYFSYQLKKLDKAIVDSSGKVKFSCDPERGMKAFIKIQDKSAIIYVDPATEEYFVSFPYQHESVKRLTGNNVRLVFDSLATDDLNTLILEFDIRVNHFLYGDNDTLKMQRTISQNKEFRDSLDLFTQKILTDYKDVKSKYFQNYVKFTFASIHLFSNAQEPDKNRFLVFEAFVKPSPILYHNDAYMNFIKEFYKGIFSDMVMSKRDKVMFAINNMGSLDKLHESYEGNYYMGNSRFRELIFSYGLFEAYHTTIFNRDNVIAILDLLEKNANDKEHRIMAQNVKKAIFKMQPGSKAPLFSWTEQHGDTTNLKDLRGKYTYIQFWASWNKPSIQDILIMRGLQEKYAKYINFVSISLDNIEKDYETFVKNNPDAKKWHFGYYQGDAEILEDYNIRNAPLYILVDMEGNIEQSPAYAPTPNGVYKSIDETFHYIKVKLEPEQEFNIGKW